MYTIWLYIALYLPPMKTELIVYKILSFLLLPVAAFFGLICLLGLLTAIDNPSMLVSVFLFACMVIYIIVSFIFLTKGIDSNKRCKPVLRDWIRINGIISFIFFLLVAISFIAIKAQPSLLNEGMRQWTSTASLPPGITTADLQMAMASLVNFFVVLSIVLLIHVLITFHLMRRYNFVFEPEKMDIDL